jgi:hypothetical protein
MLTSALRRLVLAVDGCAHARSRCLLDPPSWAYDLTFGQWADHTVKPLNPANLMWRLGQWAEGGRPV